MGGIVMAWVAVLNINVWIWTSKEQEKRLEKDM